MSSLFGDQLLSAVDEGDAAEVQHLVNEGADPNFQYDWGHPIFRACDLGKLDVIRKLVDSGSDPNIVNPRKFTPLAAAACGSSYISDAENLAVIVLLLELGANPEIPCGTLRRRQTPLQLAVINGRIHAALALLEHGADADFKDNLGNDTIDYAVHVNADDLLQVLKRKIGDDYSKRFKKAGNTKRLIEATKAGVKAEVVRLLDAGADVNAINVRACDALFCAADQGTVELIELLLDRGADPNNLEAEKTPLMACADRGHRIAFDLLLSAGGNIFAELEVAPGKFMNAMHFAIASANKELAAHIEEQMKRLSR